jgi:hypothetical protein
MITNFFSYLGLFLMFDALMVWLLPLPYELFITFAITSVLMSLIFAVGEAWATRRRDKAWAQVEQDMRELERDRRYNNI